LIEDVAHAPLAKSENQTIAGSLGDFSCYSFFSNKNISAGEGGILSVAKDSRYTKSFLKSIKSHGMSILTQDRYKKSISGYDVHEVGFNFRMHEIASSLAYVQAKKYIKHGLQKRKKIISQYRDLLQDSKLRLIFDSESDNNASPHIAVCILPKGHNRDSFMQELAKFGIQTSMHYPNIRDFSLMSDYRDLIHTPNCNEYSERCITIPLYEDLEYDDLKYIVKKLTYLLN
jgi:dTDP-4-amino-4,6-dideoxygalactose transaminase